MSDTPATPTPPVPQALSREERLAAKLRENLRRRKAQARAMDAGGETAERPDTHALSKEARKS